MTDSAATYVAVFSGTRLVIEIAALVIALVAAAAAGRHRRTAAVALAAVSVVWLAVDSTFEGPTIVALDRAHGLTVGDLPGVAGLLLAAWQLRPRHR